MSLLIKALQRAEKSKAQATQPERSLKEAEAGSISFDPFPSNQDGPAGYTLSDKSAYPETSVNSLLKDQEVDRQVAAKVFEASKTPSSSLAAMLFSSGSLLVTSLLLMAVVFYAYLFTWSAPEPIKVKSTNAVLSMKEVSPTIAVKQATEVPFSDMDKQGANSEKNGLENHALQELPVALPSISADPVPIAKGVEKAILASLSSEDSTAAVKVIRNKKSEPLVNSTGLSAYQAYANGDLQTAKRLYQQLLGEEPRNIDALLGMAAIKASTEQSDEAMGYYQKVLVLDPRNAAAQAGLVALLGQRNFGEAETRLKTLLARQPDAAYLHAALGGIYAQQNQWPSAQQAYFEAFRLDSTQAEYVYNLAVSLDQMGKPAIALDYYQQTLERITTEGGSVDRADVERRISQLRSQLGK